LLKLSVVSDTTLQHDGFILGPARRLAAAARIATFAMLHHLRGALQRTHLADTRDVAAVPLNAEFEVLVRIKALRVYSELCHRVLLRSEINPVLNLEWTYV